MKEIMNIINDNGHKNDKNTISNNNNIPSVQNINTITANGNNNIQSHNNNNSNNNNNHTSSSQQIYRVNIADGSIYTGTFKSCYKDGFGRLDFPNGLSYEGEFKNDNFNGKGILMMERDMFYEGTFKNGVKQGLGILKSIQTNYIYDGEWNNDLKHSFGRFYY